jgi:hypothetical protein
MALITTASPMLAALVPLRPGFGRVLLARRARARGDAQVSAAPVALRLEAPLTVRRAGLAH